MEELEELCKYYKHMSYDEIMDMLENKAYGEEDEILDLIDILDLYEDY